MSKYLHIACQKCHAINRVASAKLSQAPKCGKCHASLFSATPVDLTTSHFNRHITRNDIPVLVDFWAPWCGPCKTMAPAFAQAAKSLEPSVRLIKVNTESEQFLASKHSIRSIPTLVLFKNGQEIARQAGALSAQNIINWATSKQT